VPAPRPACPDAAGGCRCRYGATRPRGPILTTHLDRSARPFTFPGPTRQDHPLRPGVPIVRQVVSFRLRLTAPRNASRSGKFSTSAAPGRTVA
jgi:hypothetical protein